MERDAIFSPCGLYRYTLHRTWDESKPLWVSIMLNPSTADCEEDDATTRRNINYAKREGCGRLCALNIFAFRATEPKDMYAAADPVGPNNDEHLRRWCSEADIVVCGWGQPTGKVWRQARKVRHMLDELGKKAMCFGKKIDGEPLHFLYLKKVRPLEAM